MKKAPEHQELKYVPMQPRITPRMVAAVREVNLREERAEKKRKTIATLGAIGLGAFVVTSFYFFACALFTYGANWA